MTVDEIEKFITTDEGSKWFESKVSGLVNKKNELLDKLSHSKNELANLSELNQVQSEKISAYENYITDEFFESALHEGATPDGFFKVLDGSENAVRKVLESLSESGFKIVVKDNKVNLQDDNGKTFQEYWNEWKKSPNAKPFLAVGNSGGGAVGSNLNFLPSSLEVSRDSVNKMSVEELTKRLENPLFRNQVQSLLNNK